MVVDLLMEKAGRVRSCGLRSILILALRIF